MVEYWNNREAGDLRRHRGNYDVTVMSFGINGMKSKQAKLQANNHPELSDISLGDNNMNIPQKKLV